MANVALPFLTLPDNGVKLECLVAPAGKPLAPAPEFLHSWDYAQDLEVSARIDTDIARAARQLGLDPDTLQLRAVLYVGTGPGSMTRSVTVLDSKRLSGETQLGGQVAGDTLSGKIRLDVQILLDNPGKTRNPLAPVRRGSRLWGAHRDVILEDGGPSRFPIELASFSKRGGAGFARSGLWHVSWRPDDLDADFSGNVRLYVNSDNTVFSDRFIAGDPATLQAIVGDVMAQMISAALDSRDEAELDACEEGSLGRQIQHWIEYAFPDMDMGAIKSQRQRLPGAFMAAILACADMGDLE